MQENRRQDRTLQEELVRQRKYWKQNQIWALVLAAVVLVSLLVNPGISVATGPDALTLTLQDGKSCTVPYSSITESDLLEEPQFGTLLEGKESRQGKSGTWQHPQWGEYTLCVYAGSESAVWFQAEGQTYLVSLSSSEETRQLSQIIQEKSSASQ